MTKTMIKLDAWNAGLIYARTECERLRNKGDFIKFIPYNNINNEKGINLFF